MTKPISRTSHQELYTDLGYGITCIDTGYVRPGLAACYLIEEDGQVAFIDTGTFYTLERVMEVLRLKGLSAEDVAYIIPTHVHLDHAGGVGAFMQHFTQAKLIVHPLGARHMIDPSKLTAGTIGVYGEKTFHRLYGNLIPVNSKRVIQATDGFHVKLNNRPLVCIDTPGHARHHLCVYDKTSQGLFTGDTFGLSYREFDTDYGPFLFATTTPVQFDPDEWLTTLEKINTYHPRVVYLTHFGALEKPEKLITVLQKSIKQFAKIALEATLQSDGLYQNISSAMQQLLIKQLKHHGCRMEHKEILRLIAGDIDLNTQGLIVWLKRNESKNTSP
jgi:glyoxylase-like metal-dependent hydrolase (beta-lactamase superfamily II)